MWHKLMTVPNGYLAKIYKDLYDAEGVACRLVPPLTDDYAWSAPRDLWVPDSKTHVAAEILRKV